MEDPRPQMSECTAWVVYQGGWVRCLRISQLVRVMTRRQIYGTSMWRASLLSAVTESTTSQIEHLNHIGKCKNEGLCQSLYDETSDPVFGD
jgi:hypothetical protein